MKKVICLITLLTLTICLFSACSKPDSKTNVIENEKTSTVIPKTEVSQNTTVQSTSKKADNQFTMEDALFIGDSRTCGLSEYSGLPCDFFTSVGMSVYNINKNPIPVPKIGKVTLVELLSNKQYGKVYLMLGINEIGYDMNTTIEKYKELISLIQSKQPNAVIFIQANLHIAKKRSDSDKYVNNTALNQLNTRISKIADGKKIFYLDANSIFDDAEGNLSAEKTSDNVHLYAKYYVEWGNWISEQSKNMM